MLIKVSSLNLFKFQQLIFSYKEVKLIRIFRYRSTEQISRKNKENYEFINTWCNICCIPDCLYSNYFIEYLSISEFKRVLDSAKSVEMPEKIYFNSNTEQSAALRDAM